MAWGRRLAIATLAVLCATSVDARADCADPFADPDDVLDFHLRISRADWADLRNLGQVGTGCDAQYPYFQVEFRCGEEDWITVGARRKRGDQRGKDTDEKPPIKLDINRFVIGQRWPNTMGNLGFRRLSLNNGQEDNPGGVLTALLTEHYAWRLMRAEEPRAGGVAYARLTVHFVGDGETEYHGIYILIEDIDRTAIRARFPDDRGILLKTTTGSCRDQEVFNDGPNPVSDAVDAWLALDPADFVGTWAAETDKAVALEQLLRQEALRDVLANGADTVLGQNYSNYFSYDPLVGVRHYLPWDLDDVFRPYPQDVGFNFSLENSCSEIGDHTRCTPEISDRYLEIACQLTNGTLHPDKLLSEMAALDQMLRPIIAQEVALVWPNDDPLDDTDPTTYAGEYVRMQQWVSDRIPDVRQQITDLGYTCDEGCGSAPPESCQFLHCQGERRCEGDRWTTCLVDPSLEQSGNGQDDDCDGAVDEGDNPGGDGGMGGDGGTGPGDSGGCGCETGGGPGGTALLIVLAPMALGRRRCTDRTPNPRASS